MDQHEELERLEEKLRAEMNADREEARSSRHAIRGELQKILIELAEQRGIEKAAEKASTVDKWMFRALVAMVSAETVLILTNLGKIWP